MKKCKLGDIADLTVGYVGNMKTEYIDEGVPFFRSLNIERFKINDNDLMYISEEFNGKIVKSKLHAGDVVVVRTGIPGTCAVVPPQYDGANCSDLVIIRPHEGINPHYIAAFINFWGQKQISNNKVGAVQQHFNIGTAKEMIIFLPDNQNDIADYLVALNQKIEFNNKTIETLENIAKTLYDYWFVQFDFPDANGNPYKTSGGKMEWNETLSREIPAGWEVRQVKDIEAKIVTGKTPSTARDDFYNGNVPFVTIGDIRNHVFVTNTDIRLTKAGAESQSNKYLPPNSLCVSCIASPGEIGFTTEWSQTNQQINSIAIEDEDNRIFLYFALKDYFLYNAAVKIGNTFANMSKTDFSEIALVYPTKSVLKVFAKKTQPIFRELKKAELENQKLITLRDFLLPMLMNGQVTFRQ